MNCGCSRCSSHGPHEAFPTAKCDHCGEGIFGERDNGGCERCNATLCDDCALEVERGVYACPDHLQLVIRDCAA